MFPVDGSCFESQFCRAMLETLNLQLAVPEKIDFEINESSTDFEILFRGFPCA